MSDGQTMQCPNRKCGWGVEFTREEDCPRCGTALVCYPRFGHVRVTLVGQDSNAFAIIGAVKQAMRGKVARPLIQQFVEEATAGDFDDLLATCCRWVDVR